MCIINIAFDTQRRDQGELAGHSHPSEHAGPPSEDSELVFWCDDNIYFMLYSPLSIFESSHGNIPSVLLSNSFCRNSWRYCIYPTERQARMRAAFETDKLCHPRMSAAVILLVNEAFKEKPVRIVKIKQEENSNRTKTENRKSTSGIYFLVSKHI